MSQAIFSAKFFNLEIGKTCLLDGQDALVPEERVCLFPACPADRQCDAGVFCRGTRRPGFCVLPFGFLSHTAPLGLPRFSIETDEGCRGNMTYAGRMTAQNRLLLHRTRHWPDSHAMNEQ